MSADFYTDRITQLDYDTAGQLFRDKHTPQESVGAVGGFVSEYPGRRQVIKLLPSQEVGDAACDDWIRTGYAKTTWQGMCGHNVQGDHPGIEADEYKQIGRLVNHQIGDWDQVWDMLNASTIVAARDVMSDGPGFIGDIFLIVYPDTSTQIVRHSTVSTVLPENAWALITHNDNDA